MSRSAIDIPKEIDQHVIHAAQTVAEMFNVRVVEIFGDTKRRPVPDARMCLALVLRETLRYIDELHKYADGYSCVNGPTGRPPSWPQIGQLLSKDHSTFVKQRHLEHVLRPKVLEVVRKLNGVAIDA